VVAVSLLVPQDEINKVTTVENKHYPASVYNKFTPAKKAKHFQLSNPRKIPGTGPSGRKTNKSSVTVAELTTAISAICSCISYLRAYCRDHQTHCR
jgi:hypothetical protein